MHFRKFVESVMKSGGGGGGVGRKGGRRDLGAASQTLLTDVKQWQWRIQGRGLRGPVGPPLILDLTEAQKKNS